MTSAAGSLAGLEAWPASASTATSGAVEVVVQEMEAGLPSGSRELEKHAAPILGSLESTSLALTSALARGGLSGARDVLARLRNQMPPPAALPADLARLAQLLARDGHASDRVAELCLYGQERFLRGLAVAAERAVSDAEVRWRATRSAAAQASVHLRQLSRLFVLAHADEQSRAPRGDASSRRSQVSRALDGEWLPPGEIGYDLAGHHVGIVSEPESARRLHDFAEPRRWDVLQVPGAEGVFWTWLGSPAPIPSAEVDALTAWHREQPAAVAAIGEPASGLPGFRTSHDQALEAWTLAGSNLDRVVRYGDVALMIALLRDPALAAAFLSRELGPLAREGRSEAELRTVVRAYLESGHNAVSTASKLGYSRRTIERKVQQAETLVGHLVRQRSGELLVALQLVDLTSADVSQIAH